MFVWRLPQGSKAPDEWNIALMDGFSIRQATLADAGALYAIHVDAVINLCAGSYTQAQIAGWFVGRTQAIYTGAIRAGMIWIAGTDREALGFIEFSSREVSSLFVRSGFSGQGVGRRLMGFALETAPGIIKVEATLNAVGFYERFGFVPAAKGVLTRASGFDIETAVMRRPGWKTV